MSSTLGIFAVDIDGKPTLAFEARIFAKHPSSAKKIGSAPT
jgi:hypothetical protein